MLFQVFENLFCTCYSVKVSGEIPSGATETHSVRSTSGPLGPGEKALPYLDPRQPGWLYLICSLLHFKNFMFYVINILCLRSTNP